MGAAGGMFNSTAEKNASSSLDTGTDRHANKMRRKSDEMIRYTVAREKKNDKYEANIPQL